MVEVTTGLRYYCITDLDFVWIHPTSLPLHPRCSCWVEQATSRVTGGGTRCMIISSTDSTRTTIVTTSTSTTIQCTITETMASSPPSAATMSPSRTTRFMAVVMLAFSCTAAATMLSSKASHLSYYVDARSTTSCVFNFRARVSRASWHLSASCPKPAIIDAVCTALLPFMHALQAIMCTTMTMQVSPCWNRSTPTWATIFSRITSTVSACQLAAPTTSSATTKSKARESKNTLKSLFGLHNADQ